MRVISRRTLRDFCLSHADSCKALYEWYRVASRANWQNLIDVQATYKSAESVGNFTVFNIKGNSYRLIVKINYNAGIVFKRAFGEGKIKRIVMGSVDTEVSIEIAPGVEITSVITTPSAEHLGLRIKKTVHAVIKSTSVFLVDQ